jgi:nicotinamidase-related amidase
MDSKTGSGLRFGPLGDNALHLCVDMQNMFAEETEWHTPWMKRVLPNVERLVRHDPFRTTFTRFIPAQSAEVAQGAWRPYYEHWHSMTLDELDPAMVDLVPSLAGFVPPATLFDKTTYGPWNDGALDALLRRRGIDTLVVTGGETDVCVLGTVLGAVDRGYQVIIATDGLCSASDETHDALMLLYSHRYGSQVETALTDEILAQWR